MLGGTQTGKRLTIKYSVPDSGVGVGGWKPSQALVSFHCQADRLPPRPSGLSLWGEEVGGDALAHFTCPSGQSPSRFLPLVSGLEPH